MCYKGLIIKIQKLKAFYDREIAYYKTHDCYDPYCRIEEKIRIYQQFSDEIDSLLESEEYMMKKRFKY